MTVSLPSAATLVVTEQYSAWQCTQMLFSHLPLLKILFNLLTHSCKKVSLMCILVCRSLAESEEYFFKVAKMVNFCKNSPK